MTEAEAPSDGNPEIPELALLDLLAAAEDGLEALQAFQSRVGAVPLVLGQGDFFRRGLAGRLVHHQHGGGHRHDLGVQTAFGLGLGGALLGLQGVFVLTVA